MTTRTTYDGNGHVISIEIIEDPPAPLFSPVEIVAMFSPQELAALEASTNLAVVAFRVQFLAAINPIALDDPRFIAAVEIMRSTGILSEQRAVEVLAGQALQIPSATP